jgi:hypothetical protein
MIGSTISTTAAIASHFRHFRFGAEPKSIASGALFSVLTGAFS